MRASPRVAQARPDRRHFIRFALGGAAMFVNSTACSPPCILARPLERAGVGVYVASAWKGLGPGDVIRSVDGMPVNSPEELEAMLVDGEPHRLEVRWRRTHTTQFVELRAEGTLPFAGVGNQDLERAPSWARRGMFGRGNLQFDLRALENGQATLSVHGHARLLALVSLATSTQRFDAMLTLQVMQKAQADLAERGVSLAYARLPSASEGGARRERPVELASFMRSVQLGAAEGGPLPLPPAYEPPRRGLKRSNDAFAYLGEPPNLVLLDARGVVRWHSGGSVPDPAGEIGLPMVHTAVRAAEFARDEL